MLSTRQSGYDSLYTKKTAFYGGLLFRTKGRPYVGELRAHDLVGLDLVGLGRLRNSVVSLGARRGVGLCGSGVFRRVARRRGFGGPAAVCCVL